MGYKRYCWEQCKFDYDEYNDYNQYMATSIRLDDSVSLRLDRLAKTTGRTKAFYLRKLIEEGLEDLEDYYLGMLALEDLRSGKASVHTHEQIKAELGLED